MATVMVASGPRHRIGMNNSHVSIDLINANTDMSQLSVSTLQVSITVGRSEDNKRQTADGRGANKRPN